MSSREPAETRARRVAERRLGALQLAGVLGNVSEACRRLGIDRGSFYNWQRRFEAGGIEALRPAWHREEGPEGTKAGAVAPQLRETALAHPGWGCARLAEALAQEGIHLSPPTVQHALRSLGLPHREDRVLLLVQEAREGGQALSDEQIAVVERFEPGFRDRAARASRPGEQLLQASFHLGNVQGRRIYVHCLLDAFSSYAFARLAEGRGRAGIAASLLRGSVRELRDRGLRPRVVFTPETPAFSGPPDHPYRRAAARCRVGQVRAPLVRGQVERFRRHVLGELVRADRHLLLGETWEGLEGRLIACLDAYNVRALPGHPNYGDAPLERLDTVEKSA